MEAPEFSAALLVRQLAAHGLRPNRVVLELTEREAVEDLDRLRSVLEACQAVGMRIAADDKRTTVEVSDDGPGGTSAAGTGMGIRGMRERAEATGGTLDAGPRPGGGFTVRATWDQRP